MAQKEIYYRAVLYYENVPPICRKALGDEYMENRNKVVNIFNERITAVNEAWDRMGKQPTTELNEWELDPAYAKFVCDHIQPAIDVLNKSLHVVRYRLNNENCDIEGYNSLLKNSRIWVEMYPVQ